MKFTKMHGLGNDYIYVNCFVEQVDDPAALARVMSRRHHGVGADGLILVCPAVGADVRMEMYNSDGSRGRMCGNGIRCVAKYAYEHGLAQVNPMSIVTDAGIRQVHLELQAGRVHRVRVDMGTPVLVPAPRGADSCGQPMVDYQLSAGGSRYRMTCVSLGNPHVVVYVDDLGQVDLPREGALLERHEMFPGGINVHFATALSVQAARMISWERGSGATQACGTGACAVVVAGVLSARLQRHATVHLPGGQLQIEWAQSDHVFMTGPAEEVFHGEW